MGSNVAFALRAVVSKSALNSSGLGENLNSVNLFGVVTIWAFFQVRRNSCIPRLEAVFSKLLTGTT